MGCCVRVNDKTVRVWGAASDVCLRVLEGHTDGVRSVTALGDGRLASASGNKTVRVWDAASGVCLRVLEGHMGGLCSVAALGDGRLASASREKTVRVWDAASGYCLRVLKGHTSGVCSVAALGDGCLASAARDKTMRVWDALSGNCLCVLRGHTLLLSGTALVDGRLASTSGDGTLRMWDPATGTCLETVLFDSPPLFRGNRVPQSTCLYIFAGRHDQAIFSLGRHTRVPRLGCDSNALLTLPDGRRIAVSGRVSGQVHFLELVEPLPAAANHLKVLFDK